MFSAGVHKVDAYEMLRRAGLLKKCIRDDQKQLVALNVLQELMVHMEHPESERVLVNALSHNFVHLKFYSEVTFQQCRCVCLRRSAADVFRCTVG